MPKNKVFSTNMEARTKITIDVKKYIHFELNLIQKNFLNAISSNGLKDIRKDEEQRHTRTKDFLDSDSFFLRFSCFPTLLIILLMQLSLYIISFILSFLLLLTLPKNINIKKCFLNII